MSPMPASSHDHRRAAPPPSRRTPRILVADADDNTRTLYREWLQLMMTGSDVVDAADGRDAMVKALSVRPTLVITELRLPLFDGFALCGVLRRDSLTRTVPIVVVTAETHPSEADRAQASGASVVLIKPVAPETLLREIHRLLEPRPPAAEVPEQPRTPPPTPRRVEKKSYQRVTTATPPVQPPDLWCPQCDRPLSYERSFVGGVSQRHPEQWDEYRCANRCGLFEYRHRTRKLRGAS